MKIENIEVTKTVEKVKRFVTEDKSLSPAAKAMFELLLVYSAALHPDFRSF